MRMSHIDALVANANDCTLEFFVIDECAWTNFSSWRFHECWDLLLGNVDVGHTFDHLNSCFSAFFVFFSYKLGCEIESAKNSVGITTWVGFHGLHESRFKVPNRSAGRSQCRHCSSNSSGGVLKQRWLWSRLQSREDRWCLTLNNHSQYFSVVTSIRNPQRFDTILNSPKYCSGIQNVGSTHRWRQQRRFLAGQRTNEKNLNKINNKC